MKKLIDVFQKIDKILSLLDKIMHEEHICLLNIKTDIKKLSHIIKEKHSLLNQLDCEKKAQLSLEKKYNIKSYLKFNELSDYSNKLKNKCVSLNKINIKNKKLIEHKFYLNQSFLNCYKSYSNNTIYDIDGKL